LWLTRLPFLPHLNGNVGGLTVGQLDSWLVGSTTDFNQLTYYPNKYKQFTQPANEPLKKYTTEVEPDEKRG
jgi:hypothetical protein